MLDELAALGFPLQPGEIGENILTARIDLLSLPRGTRLHLGTEAVIEVTGLRTPCSRIDDHRRGLQQHLWGPPGPDGKKARRCGIMATVLTGGVVQPDDAIRITLPPQPHLPLGPV
jgi:MOSC domain-containing protein YiiM